MGARASENTTTMREEDWTSEREPYADSVVAGTPEPPSRVMREFLLREASDLLQQAIEAELEWFLARCSARAGGSRRRAVVRNGYQPARELTTSIGPVSIRLPKVRSRESAAVFRSMLLKPYLRRTQDDIEEAPEGFLKALSEGDVQAAVGSVVGPVGVALSPMVTRRLDEHWQSRHGPWLRGTLEPMRCEWLWFDRVDFGRGDCRHARTLVVVGQDRGAGARLLAVRSAADATESWIAVLTHLHARGLQAGFRWAQSSTVCGDVDAAVLSVFRTIHPKRC